MFEGGRPYAPPPTPVKGSCRGELAERACETLAMIEPPPPRDVAGVLARFVEACSADDRIVAAFLGGSHARGTADGFSDLDLCLIATDEGHAEVVADREAIVRSMGEPLFLEHFGSQDHVFFILADGTEGELYLGRESALDAIEEPTFRVLLDERGVLARATFAAPVVDAAEQAEALRAILAGFWHEVAHLVTALGRGQAWWAIAQLEAMRTMCVNVVRIEHGVAADAEPSFKVDEALPLGALDELRTTYVPLEERAILGSASEVVRVFRAHGRRAADAFGLPYPDALDALVAEHLRSLEGPP
jgi:predicted nucleotidyltransferase